MEEVAAPNPAPMRHHAAGRVAHRAARKLTLRGRTVRVRDPHVGPVEKTSARVCADGNAELNSAIASSNLANVVPQVRAVEGD
jgi:hypothetical protein